MENKQEKQLTEFALSLSKLTPQEVIGCARLLGVKLADEKLDEKHRPVLHDAGQILEDIIVAYAGKDRATRRDLLKVVKSTIKGR